MKTILFLLILGINFTLFTQNKNSLKAYLDHKQFYHHQIGNFIEIHIQFVSYSMKFVGVEGGLESEIGIQYEIKNEENQIVNSDAYRLKSPIMKDSIIEDFYELKRIVLKPGTYKFDLILTDVNNNNEPIKAFQEIKIEDLSKQTLISNIEVAEIIHKSKEENAFSKFGFDIIPRISNYYSSNDNTIPVYFEIYQTDSLDKLTLGLKQTVKDVKTKEEIEALTRFTKLEIGQIHPIIRALDISSLQSGEFELEYTLISKENIELAKSTYYFERFSEANQEMNTESVILDPNFQKSISDDSLKFYISSLIPISNPTEVKNILKILKTKNNEMFRKYIQSYWTTSANGNNIYDTWIKYKAQVQLVNKLYGNNFMDGHETDRGRIYLKYGSPNNIISREVSPTDCPYEIWRYDKIKNYSNRKFIFYNPDLVNNNYRLLHSDVIGETKNPRWQQYLQKGGSKNTDIYDDKSGIIDSFGNKSGEFFNQY
jgi:GWxTD domain-containing protein